MSHARNLARQARSGIITVDTADDLRNLTIYSGLWPESVQTLGCNTAGDGGGGLWRWDAASTDADNLGTVLLPAGSTGAGRWVRERGEQVDSLWFCGDKTGDLTTEITAAVAVAKAGEGVLKFSSRSAMYSCGYVNMSGIHSLTGNHGAVIKSTLSTGTNSLFEWAATNDIHVEGLSFRPLNEGSTIGPTTVTTAFLDFTTCKQVTVTNNYFKDSPWYAVNLEYCEEVAVNANQFDICAGGIRYAGLLEAEISNNVIKGTNRADNAFGVGITGALVSGTQPVSRDISIVANTISDLKWSQGIMSHEGIGYAIVGNVIKGCAQGISINRPSVKPTVQLDNFTVTGNIVRGLEVGDITTLDPAFEEVGITLQNATNAVNNVIVANNSISHFSYKKRAAGLRLQHVNSCTVTGNVINDIPDGDGVHFPGTNANTDVVVADNVFEAIGNTWAGSGAIRLDTTPPSEVLIKDNRATNCQRVCRIDQAASQNLIVDFDRSDNNLSPLITGSSKAVVNGIWQQTGGTTCTVNRNIRGMLISHSTATTVTQITADDLLAGHTFTIVSNKANTTLQDASNGSNMKLGGADLRLTRSNSVMLVWDNTDWRIVGT